MWTIKLSGCYAVASPLLEKSARRIEFDDTRVVGNAGVMAVADEDISVGSDRGGARRIEFRRSVANNTGNAKRQEKLSVLIELDDLVALAIADMPVRACREERRRSDHAGGIG